MNTSVRSKQNCKPSRSFILQSTTIFLSPGSWITRKVVVFEKKNGHIFKSAQFESFNSFHHKTGGIIKAESNHVHDIVNLVSSRHYQSYNTCNTLKLYRFSLKTAKWKNVCKQEICHGNLNTEEMSKKKKITCGDNEWFSTRQFLHVLTVFYKFLYFAICQF